MSNPLFTYETHHDIEAYIRLKKKAFLRQPIILSLSLISILLIVNMLYHLFYDNFEPIILTGGLVGGILLFSFIKSYLGIKNEVINNPLLQSDKIQYEFYDSYYIVNNNGSSRITNYEEVVQFEETDMNIHLISRNQMRQRYIDIFNKNKISKELLNFLYQFKGRDDSVQRKEDQKYYQSLMPKYTNLTKDNIGAMISRGFFGLIGIIFGIIGFQNGWSSHDGLKTADIIFNIFCIIFGLLIFYSIYRGIKSNKAKEELRKEFVYYDSLWKNDNPKSIEKLSKLINKSYEETYVIVQIMMRNGYYPDWYMDHVNKQLVKGLKSK